MGRCPFFLIWPVWCLLVFLLAGGHGAMVWPSPSPCDPTQGFKRLPLNSSNFHVHSPYDLPVAQRYVAVHGVHTLWALASDKPFKVHSPTAPRSEIKIQGYDYSSGVWQFEGHAYVPSGTSGVCIMQVFGATSRATTLMLRVYNGALMYYRSLLVADDIYGRWFRVNVIHDVEGRTVKVFINSVLRLTVDDHGGASHYFKFGVYGQNGSSYFMESRWKAIKVFKKWQV
uniref:Citrate-binding protein n=1 Tax=Anthurium amnicola TaxID=1678845 RepID=A0A1D1ZGW7_9ARAE